MSSMTGIALYVNPSVAHAAREMGLLLADHNYSPQAIAEIVAYTIAEGTPTGAPSLDPEDEADAALVFETELEPVPYDSPAWGEFADADLPPVTGGGPDPADADQSWWAAYCATDWYVPTSAEWAEMMRHRDDDGDDRAAPSGAMD